MLFLLMRSGQFLRFLKLGLPNLKKIQIGFQCIRAVSGAAEIQESLNLKSIMRS